MREAEGREPEPSGTVVDARSVRGGTTVTGASRGFDGGKKVSGRKAFGFVDTGGLLVGVAVFPASVSDNFGGIAVFDLVRAKLDRLAKVWCDGGFKTTFVEHCRQRHVAVEVVNKIHADRFEALPRRWVVERTWSSDVPSPSANRL